MKDLIRKYRENKLSREDLRILRDKLQSIPPEDLNKAVLEDWENYPAVNYDDDDPHKEKTLCDIHHLLKIERKGFSNSFRNISRNVAAMLLPVFMIATIYYYTHPAANPSFMAVTTEKGERASVFLPDGSRVMLNGSSSISYDADAFSRGNRNIEFSGEAFFNITKDPRHPFAVNATVLKVTVMGTKFNLKAVRKDPEAVLYLKSGLVSLLSEKSGKNAIVHPGEKAVLNYGNGHISISQPDQNENILAWHTKKLSFNDEDLYSVISTIEKYYGCKIIVEGANIDNSIFTGTIPTDNLQLSIDVIERIFNVRLKIKK